MARGITEQDVLEAADALLTRGERPTIERVRQELGRGSPNTVNRHLDAWWISLAQRMQGRSGSALPASLLELCGRLYAGVCEQAQAKAQARLVIAEDQLKASRDELDTLRASLALEKADAAVAGERHASEMTALRARNEVLVGEKAQLKTEVERLGASVIKAESVSQASRATLDRGLAKHQAEVERIRGQWEGNEKRWLNEIGHLRDDIKRLRAEQDVQVKALRKQLKESNRSLATALKARSAFETDLAKRNTQLIREREARLQAEAACTATKALVHSLQRTTTAAPPRHPK